MAPRLLGSLGRVAIIFLAALQFGSQSRLLLSEQISTSSHELSNFLDGIGVGPFSLTANYDTGNQFIRAVPTSQLSKTDAVNDPHFSNVEFLLDLFDWELESYLPTSVDDEMKNGTTQEQVDSHHIVEMCRVGTITKSRNTCGNQPVEHYHSLRDSVLRDHIQPLPTLGISADSSTKCDLCRILNLCLEHNITLGIYGDSMTRQMMESFECGLFRRRYQIQKPFQGKAYTKYIITSPQWGERTVTIHSYIQFKVLPEMSNPQAPGNHPDINVILTSFGLHHSAGAISVKNSQADYRKAVARLYEHLKSFMTTNSTTTHDRGHKKFKLMLHRETSAQHFDAEGGDFFWAREKNERLNASAPLTCVRFQQGPSVGWREMAVKEAVTAAGFEFETHHVEGLERRQSSSASQVLPSGRRDKIVVLPFFNFTTTLHKYHPLYLDCTHFCYSPYLWWPLWRSLRIAMEEGLTAT